MPSLMDRPPFYPHPDLMNDPAYVIVTIHTARAIQSYRKSLLAYEWIAPDGTLKSMDDLGPSQSAARHRIESQFKSGQALLHPIIGWGLFDCLEIGAGRDVFLTLAALGIQHIPVHAPVQMIDSLRPFIVEDSNKRHSERGNILLYILLAVVLLAALTYAVAGTSRSGGITHLSDSKASTLSTEILTYANHLKTAISKLSLRGCTETQINFENTVVAGYVNATAPVDDSCDVFAASAGAVTWVTPPDDMNDGTPWFYTGAAVAHNSNGYASSNSAADADLVMMISGLPQNLCTKINKQLGITGTPINDSTYGDTTKFQGSYSYAEDINGLPEASQPSPCSAPSTAQNFCGRDAGCFREEGGTQRYVFFQVLLRR